VLLEVIAETVEDAREAEQGGAGRIELVRDLDRGGLTPPLALIEAVVKAVRIPVRVMLRESEPFELRHQAELGRLHAAARDAHARGANGFVAGFLRNGAIDVESMREAIGALASPVTFHRAFDEAGDPLAALAALAAETRVDRVLTSGGAGEWPARFTRLRALRLAAPPHLTILPGGGIDGEALRALAGAGFPEAHVGRAARVPGSHSGRVRASRVAELVALATGSSRTAPT
jgi:copper homeostasis protein